MAAPPEESNSTETDLATLIDQARGGSLAAFERIMLLHERRVFRVALATLRNAEDAGDATQEVFLKVHRGLGSFRSGNSFMAWIYRITINVCRDIQRKRRTSFAYSLDALTRDGAMPHPADGGMQSDEQTLQNQRRRILSEALKHLPPKERTALILRDIEGLSASEASAILGSSESSIRSHASRARAKLRAIVERRLKGS